MPYNKDAYTRYKLIDQRLRNTRIAPPSLQELIEYVSDKLGKQVSISSIQKDIEAMRHDANLGFNAPIVYDRYSKAYKYAEPEYSIDKMNISEEDLQGLETALGILEQFKSVPAIKYFEEAISRMSASVKKNREVSKENIFLLDRPNKYLGAQFMNTIVDGIRDKRVIKISYQSFNKLQAKEHIVHPYFIKEYDARLYLIANDIAAGKAPKFLTFSFDRMQRVTDTYDSFKEEFVDKVNYFTNALGISHVDGVPEKIVLSFHPSQAGYLKTQPIHHSQTILKDTDKEFKIQLQLVVNPELQMRILSHGSKVKVMEPNSLKDFVAAEAEKMIEIKK
jgi:predicted DNA-binding transcriptional regulator YafY